MAEPDDEKALAEERTDWAERRTNWAEDRTVMANERTFAGWMRTGLASVGIGVGFHALFGRLEPLWFPKALASIFVAVGIGIFMAGQHKAARVAKRLEAHKSVAMRGLTMQLMAGAMIAASVLLIAALWLLDLGPA